MDLNEIYSLISANGFANATLDIIDKYIKDIQDGSENFPRFNIPEHAGLCSAGEVLIGASIIASYASASLTASRAVTKSQDKPANWEIDAFQERIVEEWARAKKLWIENSEQLLTENFGSQIAQGAEAKVYYKSGDIAVVKERASIYSTLQKAFDAIILHNYLFPETAMRVIAMTRDSDGLFRVVLTQPYIKCKRLASKKEIDDLVSSKGFSDNNDGYGINYTSPRLLLEDMHPANVFIDDISDSPICIDCIVKFR